MDNMLSVYFSSDRTYISVVGRSAKGLELKFVDATDSAVDLETPEDLDDMIAADEVREILGNLDYNFSRVSVTLPADSVLVTKIPSSKDMKFEEIKKLVELEIRNAYPQFNYEDFIPSVLKFEPKLDGKIVMLATIISKINFISCRDILKVVRTPISNIEISQLNAHNCFLYNYPEHKRDVVAILGVGRQFIDISVIVAGKPIYYNLIAYKDKEEIGDLCVQEFENITNKYVSKIDAAYFFGEYLDIDMLVIAQSLLMMTVPKVAKLNAFRMFETKMNNRLRDYCSRTAHIFPPCVGGNLPSYHQKIKMF